jgi:manganese efflux pump family protein
MSLLAILFMGLALAMDSTAVSLAASTAGQITDRRSAIRLSFHFGLFQGMMPVLGWVVGGTIEPFIADFDHWLAFILLMFVAINMLRAAFSDDEFQADDPSRGRTMIILSVATSIDALAVGLSLKMLDIPIWLPGLLFGVVTMAVCLVAMQVGTRVGSWLDKQAQFVGGLVLIFIAVRIVITHTAG